MVMENQETIIDFFSVEALTKEFWQNSHVSRTPFKGRNQNSQPLAAARKLQHPRGAHSLIIDRHGGFGRDSWLLHVNAYP